MDVAKVVLADGVWPRELFKYYKSAVIENLKCAICFEISMKPKRCSDEHLFCGPCITQWLQRSKTCPVGRTPLKASTLSTYRLAKAMIEEQKVYCLSCTYEQNANLCQWTGKLGQLKEHLKRCEYVLVKCPSNGCTKKVQSCDLKPHLLKSCDYSSGQW